jgi:hypothetical protein
LTIVGRQRYRVHDIGDGCRGSVGVVAVSGRVWNDNQATDGLLNSQCGRLGKSGFITGDGDDLTSLTGRQCLVDNIGAIDDRFRRSSTLRIAQSHSRGCRASECGDCGGPGCVGDGDSAIERQCARGRQNRGSSQTERSAHLFERSFQENQVRNIRRRRTNQVVIVVISLKSRSSL